MIFFFHLEETLHFNVVRTYMGRFMTSLEMAGVSLTLMNVDSNILKLLGKFYYNYINCIMDLFYHRLSYFSSRLAKCS